ncbi:MAG: hypothetical protein OSA97_04745 [Nevskia sp.]|nr:hypothetical protein [Nevskia sp.]
MSNVFTHCLLTIEAEHHPQTPARILEHVTRHNLLPQWFSLRRLTGDRVRIVLELDAFELNSVDLMAKRIANIPSVISVSRTLMRRRTPIMP